MKIFSLTLLVVLLTACNNDSKKNQFSDDYVLLEFASKLEEDYHKLESPSPDQNDKNKESSN